QPPAEFERWLAEQAEPVVAQPDQGLRQDIADGCAPCHAMRGLFEDEGIYSGDLGPDLTHVASRRSLAAGAMPMTREGLGRWVIDPQGVKPGNGMPDVNLDPDTL